jgi:hypothetical protein
MTSVLLRFLPNSTTLGRSGCLTSTASATRLRALETLTWRATLTCTIWRSKRSVPVRLRIKGGRSSDREGMGGVADEEAWLFVEIRFAIEAWQGIGGEDDGDPKMVVLMDEAKETAVLGVGGSEFSLRIEQRGELDVVVDSGRGTALAVMGVACSEDEDTEGGDKAVKGAVMERFGGRGRCATGPL